MLVRRIPLARVLVHLAAGWRWAGEDGSGWSVWMVPPSSPDEGGSEAPGAKDGVS